MMPTIHNNDFVLIEHFSKWNLKSLKRGDIIACTSPTPEKFYICKRIIGLEDDLICVDPTLKERSYVKVPKGHIWLQGDNLPYSTDSRSYGPVPMNLIEGKVLMRFWPDYKWFKNGFEETKNLLSGSK